MATSTNSNKDQNYRDGNSPCKPPDLLNPDHDDIERIHRICEQVLEGDEAEGDLERRHKNCQKNPGHQTFIPVSEFTMDHLPEEHRNQETMDLIKRKIDLTVCIRVPYTSVNRPDVLYDCNDEYPFAQYKGKSGIIRYGSGCVTDVTKMDGEKCPCHPCQDLADRKEGYWKISVTTATHVIFDNSEAQRAEFKCFFDSDDNKTVRKLYGLGLDGMYDQQQMYQTDFNRKVVCATHDQETAERLSGEFSSLMTLDVSNFVYSTPAVMISHPHGCSKRITIGNLLYLSVPINYGPPCLEEFTICHTRSDEPKKESNAPSGKKEMSLEEAVEDSLKTAIMASIPESEDNTFERIQSVSDGVYVMDVSREPVEMTPIEEISDVWDSLVHEKIDASTVPKPSVAAASKSVPTNKPKNDTIDTAVNANDINQNAKTLAAPGDETTGSIERVEPESTTHNANFPLTLEEKNDAVDTPVTACAMSPEPGIAPRDEEETSDKDSEIVASLNAILSATPLENQTTVIDILEPKFGRVPIFNKPEMFVEAFNHSATMALEPTSTILEPGGRVHLPHNTTFKLPENPPYAIRYFKEGNGRFTFPNGTRLITPDGEDKPIPNGAEFENPIYSPRHFDIAYSIDTCPACSGAPVYCDLTDGQYFLTHYGSRQMHNKSGVHTSVVEVSDFTYSPNISNVW